jgi:predicted nucleic acid-binding protein
VSVLVDTSIWIDFFRDQEMANLLEQLIEENIVVTNELILAEMIPQLSIRGQNQLVYLLNEIERQPLKINWNSIIQMQINCISGGINGIGIPDLIIAQNAIQGNLR